MKHFYTQRTASKLLMALSLCIFGTNLYGQIPTISSFSPTSGPIGTTVTISGTNFNTTPENNIVFFGATQATVNAATPTELSVTVPVGATHDFISVLNNANGLIGNSIRKFIPSFSPNTGTITASDFVYGGNFTTGNSPIKLAVGDMDGDGKPDLITVNNDGGSPQDERSISVLRNTSTVSAFSFAPKVDFTSDFNIRGVALGDLDGDGKLDMALVGSNSAVMSIFKNTSTPGTISFAPRIDFATAPSLHRSLAISDLDGDGKLDIVICAPEMSFLRNTSTSGTISFAPYIQVNISAQTDAVAIGDLDNDDKPDIVVTNYIGNSVRVLRNLSTLGTLNFNIIGTYPTITLPLDVSIGDMDGDGKLDVAVCSFANGTTILRNTSTTVGSFNFASTTITSNANHFNISLGDIDGDGKLDFSVVDMGFSKMFLYKNLSSSGTINIAPQVSFNITATPSQHIADLDGDGIPDIAMVLTNFDAVTILKNSPAGLGIEETNQVSSLTVYPNPVKDYLIIKSNENSNLKAIEILDISGRVLQTINPDVLTEVNVDVSHLSSGNYVLKLTSDSGITVKKFIKI
ncbi:MAG: FG-GAP-like repeat-containing protein [Gelidibacter sp.]